MARIDHALLTDFSGGVNLHGQPLSIGANDLLVCENMYPVASGYLSGRGGQTEYNSTAIDSNPIKSLYRFYKQDGTGILLATSGTNVYKGNDGAGTFSSILAGQTSGQRYSFTTWTAKDKVYWTNNAQALQSYDGTTVAAVGGSPPVGSQVELYLDRLYILLANGVRFSDLNVDNVWQAAALLNISDNKGGMGAFLKAANRVLIAGKTTGLWRLDGSPLLGNVFIPYSDVGCIAPWTADVVTVTSNDQVVPAGVAFLGRDGMYITDGYSVTLISTKIDTLFTGFFRGAVGKYYPKQRQYFLSFDTAGAANDTLWVATNVDVAGSRVAWTEYTGFKCDSFAVWDGGNDNGEFFAGRSDTGKVRKLDIGAQDVGANYTCSFTSRYLGTPLENKQVRWLKPVFDATKPVFYQIDYFLKQASSGPVSADLLTGVWDSGTWDVGTWGGASFNSARTSVLDYKYGRYYSFKFSNTGDGPSFRFFQLSAESRIKDRRVHDVFTLNQNP